MGILASRNRSISEDVDHSNLNPLTYRYPPKEGNYFADYFIMGGERFEVQQPEAYLFGDNQDLNFLGTRPVPFPYSAPQSNEPTKTLRALINVRKESVRFIRTSSVDGSEEPAYTVEFLFDTDVSCSVTVYFGCAEEIMTRGVRYVSRMGCQPETFHYKPGAAQLFSQPTLVWSPCDNVAVPHVQTTLYPNGTLMNRVTHVVPGTEGEIIPVVIVCQAEEGDDPKQHQATYCLIERSSDATFVLKALKQKLYIDGLAYLLQDIYGIENKHSIQNRETEDQEAEIEDEDGNLVEECDRENEDEEAGGECVICMSDPRDTLILPCRHLCLCQLCADSLRYQANNCPICRAPFRALLQIRALRKLQVPPSEYTHLEDCVPVGYEPISLLEALNGLTVVSRRNGQRRAIENDASATCPVTEPQSAVNEQPEDTVISVDSAEPVSSDAILEEVENEGTGEVVGNSKSFTECGSFGNASLSPTGGANRLGWNRMNNYRRSLGAVGGENNASVSPPTIQGPLRRTRSAHTRRPPMNVNSSMLGPRGATSPSLRSSGDSCSSADSTRRLVKPNNVASTASPGLD